MAESVAVGVADPEGDAAALRTEAGADDPVDVLIADDDPALRAGLRLLLERAGYRCAEAGDGEQALALACRRRPCCVLLDLAMPRLGGLAVARLLRADPRLGGTPVNCLTGLAGRGAREQALRAGCEHVLTKPLDAAAVLAVVRRQVGGRGAEQLGGLTKAQAEELLDWLERGGVGPLDVSLDGRGGLVVRWPSAPGRSPGAGQARDFLARAR